MFEVPGAITMSSAVQVLKAGAAALHSGETAVSLRRADGSDSSALAVLLSWTRQARANDRALQFSDVPATLKSLAKVYGVAELMPGLGAAE